MVPAESQGEAEMEERKEEDVEVAEEPADAPMVEEGEDDKSAKPPEDTTDNAKMEEDKVEPAKEEETKVDTDGGYIDKDSEEKNEEEVKLEGAKVEEKDDTSGGTEQELPMDEKPKEPEYSKELEEDAPADERAKLAEGAAKINTVDTTLNVLTCYNGKILTALSDGGFQHLFAAARGTVGLKHGRYLFEVGVVESRNPTETSPPNQGKGHAPPRQLFRVGFTAAGSSLFLSDTADGVGFDSEGNFLQERSRTRISQRLTPSNQVFGVLLNLDEQSPNANTVSLFQDGVRVCPPQSIPENLKGKALFPTVNYKNMALHVNFGPTQFAALPFTCRMLQNAAEEDVEVAATASPDGKREVVFPVGLPDEGTFDWLDSYMKENHGYTELSDRAVLEWAQRSGLWRPRGYMHRVCNDRPGMEFGIKEMDDLTIRRMMHAIAPTLRRNYVVMEVRNNLLASERKKALAHFESSEFRKVALVVMGEPPEEHKTLVQSLMLNDKRQRAASEVKRRKHFEERKGADEYDKEPEDKNDYTKDEENKEKCEAKEETEKEVDGDGAPAEQTIELTEEEKKLWFRKGIVEDLTKKELGHSFSTFTIPDMDEGFDEIKFVWQAPDSCTKYLNHWIFEHKLTQRVEDLQPGSWFREKYSEWTKLVQDWKSKQSAWKEQGNKGQDFKRKEPTDKEEKDVDNGGGEAKPDEENTEEMKQDTAAEDLDVFSVEDVNDIGNGEPMYANFTYEDWTLLSLRFELHLLVHAFKVDMNDPERTSFREGHLAFYYNAYYKKSFNVKFYGCSTVVGLLDMIKDTLEVGPKMSLLDPQLADDTPFSNFVKLCEDHRRRRQRRVDMGDETATLKFQRPSPRTQSQTYGQPQMTRGNNSGYASRAPPPVPQGRGGTYPRGRDGPPGSRTTPSGPLSRYGSNTDTRGSSGGYGGGGSNYRGSGGGGPPQRYGYNSNNNNNNSSNNNNNNNNSSNNNNNNSNNPVPAPPPARSYAGQYSYGSSSSGAQKRSYQPPSGGGSYPPYKQQRTSSYTAPPTGRSSYPSYGDGGRGSGTGGGYSSSYRR